LSLPQTEALSIVAGMLCLFVSDRLRYDLVAALALSAAVVLGIVPGSKAFSGFASPVIVIIASVLVISRAITVSGVIEIAMRRLLRVLHSTTMQVGMLTAAVTLLSAASRITGTSGRRARTLRSNSRPSIPGPRTAVITTSYPCSTTASAESLVSQTSA